MMQISLVDDPADPRLRRFTSLTDAAQRMRAETDGGFFTAESFPVLERALAAGYAADAVLAQEKWLPRLGEVLGDSPTEVLVVSADLAEQVTGFAVHRGVIASMRRRPLPAVPSLLADARTVVVLEDVSDSTNVGAIFRTAAALGADAVLVTPRSSDPLYRRSVRVSMGTVFQVPWTRTGTWAELAPQLAHAGFDSVALALREDAVDLADYRPPARVAVVFGAEGAGLSEAALRAVDRVLTIPMDGGVDSLNVASASAVVLWALRSRG